MKRQQGWYRVLVLVASVCVGNVVMADGEVSGPGTYKRKMDVRVGLTRRSYYVHVPRSYNGETPMPVVIALHGAFSKAKTLQRRTGFNTLADQEGFIVIYPQGIGLMGMLRHWNSGHCCGKALKDEIDDVGFVMSVVDDVASRLHIDRTRLYVTGFSNGGMLAHRIAAERAASIAAAAPVSATIGGRPAGDEPEWTIPAPAVPVPILMMHGTADEHVPYEGGQGPKSPGKPIPLSVSRSVEFWVKQNGCQPDPSSESERGGRVLRQDWKGCRSDAAVVLYTLKGWDHRWPGPLDLDQPEADDEALRGFDAARIIWDFFKRYRKEPGS